MVPKKHGKWRVILHLSAPSGRSINDFINKEEFTLHYSTIDNAVALLGNLKKGSLDGKNGPQISLSDGAYSSIWMGTDGHALERQSLHRYMPPLWAPLCSSAVLFIGY